MKRKFFSAKVFFRGPPSPFLLQVIGLEAGLVSGPINPPPVTVSGTSPVPYRLTNTGFLGHRCLGRAQLLPTCANFETFDLAQMTAGFFPLCFTVGDKKGKTVTRLGNSIPA
jgi:hypothetical protein